MKSFVTIFQKLNFDSTLKALLILVALMVSPFVGFEKGSKNLQWQSETVLLEQLAPQLVICPTTPKVQDEASCVWRPLHLHL